MAGRFEHHHKHFTISKNHLIATKTTKGAATAFLGKVDSGIHQWTFKLKQKTTYVMVIGIWKGNAAIDTSAFLAYEGSKGKFYGYDIVSPLKTTGDGNEYSPYGVKCKTGDTVHMILDLNKYELRYLVNNNDFGVSHKVQKTSYRAAVYAYGKGDSFEIVSYKTDNKKGKSNMSNNVNEELKCNSCNLLLKETMSLNESVKQVRKQNDELISEIALKNGIVDSLNEQIKTFQADKIKSDQINDKLMEKNDDTQSQTARDKIANEEMKNQYESIKREMVNLQKINSELRKQKDKMNEANIKLNDECKQLQTDLNEMAKKYDNVCRTMNINESEYLTWDVDTIVDWILNLEATYEKYENILRTNLKKEEVDGSLLSELDKNDLHRFGVVALKDKIAIIKHIKRLTTQKKQRQFPQYDEGNNGTAYL